MPIICSFFIIFILGGFYDAGKATAGGLGHFSANLLSLLDPAGFSRFLDPLTIRSGQYEGFSYIGMGIILLCIIAFILFSYQFLYIKRKPNIHFYIVVGLITSFLLIALSPVITFGDKILFTIPYPNFITKPWSVFRSSGRFMWPILYIIFILVLVFLYRQQKPKIAFGIMSMALILQIFDLHPYLPRYIKTIQPQKDIFDNINMENINKIILLDSIDTNINLKFAKLAIEHNVAINDFYIARKNTNKIRSYQLQILKDIENKKNRQKSIIYF